MTSIFERIIAGEIPSYTIWEDERLLAFLDVNPLHLGHTLLVPKQAIDDVLDIPDDLYSHLMLTAKNILAPAIRQATWCTRIGYQIEWFGVPDHAHLHLIPLYGFGDFHPEKAHKESPENMEMIAQKIRSFL